MIDVFHIKTNLTELHNTVDRSSNFWIIVRGTPGGGGVGTRDPGGWGVWVRGEGGVRTSKPPLWANFEVKKIVPKKKANLLAPPPLWRGSAGTTPRVTKIKSGSYNTL